MFASSIRRLARPASLSVVLVTLGLPIAVAPAAAQSIEIDTVPELFDFGKMWTYEYAPTDYFTRTYGFDASPEWFDRVRLSVLRVPGCSASFVSPNGLVATNHHCIRGRLASVSRPGESLLDDGFYAETLDQERRIPDYQVDRLLAAVDVSDEVLGAVDRADPEDRAAARATAIDRVRTRLGNEYGGDVSVEVRALYHGGRYSAYVFRRFTDVRLVAAVELDLGHFGGDPDNFTYPRYALDFAFLRVYEDGEPFSSRPHLEWSLDGVSEGSVVFVVGNPGPTSRLLTVSQLAVMRDVITPVTVRALGDRLAAMREFYAAHPDEGEAMNLRPTMFSYSNSLKAYSGRLDALRTPQIWTRKRLAEEAFRDSLSADPSLAGRYAGVFQRMAAVQAAKAELADAYGAFRLLTSTTGSPAVLRRAAIAAQIPGLRAAGRSALADTAAAAVLRVPDLPPPLEHRLLTLRLDDFRRHLGSESPVVQVALQGMSPAEAASAILQTSGLATREEAAAAVEDPALAQDIAVRLAREVVPVWQRFGTEWRRLSDTEEQLAGELGRARFAVYGTRVPPDATSSPRITDGVVRPYTYNGTRAPVYTTLYGLYDHYYSYGTDSDWALPEDWVPPPAELDLSTPLNFISTADTYGGNSGSPAVTPGHEMVGLNFDRNIEGLSRDFIYLPERGRNIMVDVRAITEVLDDIYDADRIVEELITGRLVAREADANEEVR